jgi:hypothetical protein
MGMSTLSRRLETGGRRCRRLGFAAFIAGTAFSAAMSGAVVASAHRSPAPSSTPTPTLSPTAAPSHHHAGDKASPSPSPAPTQTTTTAGTATISAPSGSSSPSTTTAKEPSKAGPDDHQQAAPPGSDAKHPKPDPRVSLGAPVHAAPRAVSPFPPLPRRSPAAPEDLLADLDGTSIPPVEAMTPMAGLDFGSGFEIGPVMALLDAFGLVALLYVVRRYCGADMAR